MAVYDRLIMGNEGATTDPLAGVDGPASTGKATLVHTASPGLVQPCLEYQRTAPADRTACLTVTLTDGFDTVIDRWEQHPGDRPAELAVITAGDITRSASAGRSTGYVELPAGVKTTGVADAGDLTGIAIRIQQALDGWAEGGPEHVVVCFDSLTTLAQYADSDRIFRFLHAVTGRLREAGVMSHFHIDPDAHDDRTLARLASLFDGVRTDPPLDG